MVAIDEEVPVTIAPAANDAPGPGGGPLTTTITTDPQHGHIELQPNGSYLYTPDLDWSGDDAISYIAKDGISENDAQIAITVRPIAEAPWLADDAILINQELKARNRHPGQRCRSGRRSVPGHRHLAACPWHGDLEQRNPDA